MPPPARGDHRYVPGLDGIRAVAVLCVIAYHLNLSWAKGGMLGVGVFFTLSGYLITDLLLSHWRRRGDLGLGQFWLRRARRLLPALFVMLVVVSVWVALFDAGQLAATRRQVLAAAVYISNWSTIAQHGSYFARFAAPLPLDHLWSLAIEEQFYLLWPWLLLFSIWAVRNRWALAILTLLGAAGSAVGMSLLHHPGLDPTRVYEGTDTRAFGLLIGAALAMVLPSHAASRGWGPPLLGIVDVLGAAGLLVVFLLVLLTNAFTSFIYPTGFLLLSLATAAVIVAAINPTSRLGAGLGCRPLRWVGVRSYGIYLWQWPIIVLVGQGHPGSIWRALLEVVATFLAAAISWRYIEDPIRRGRLGRAWRGIRSGMGRWRLGHGAVAAGAAAVAGLLLATFSLTGALPAASAGTARVAFKKLRHPPTDGVAPNVLSVLEAARNPTRTSCKSVVYIGDSTSEGETSTDYIPNPRRRLPAQLGDVGVTTTYSEISGARAIVEHYEGQPSAADVVKEHIAAGFNGCWIIAMGTNDVDNVNGGGLPGFSGRIDQMMSAIGSQPVMWVNVITLLQDGPYSENGMEDWNRALLAACSRYPNLRVFDWASHAKASWFIPDGIHYYSPGYVARAHLIARGLAAAFPKNGPPNPSCVVR